METKRYNGWTNYETWAVCLWLDNSEGDQQYWIDAAEEVYDAAPTTSYATKAEMARIELADRLKDELTDNMPELGASLWADLLGAAMSEVDWREIADHYLSEFVDAE